MATQAAFSKSSFTIRSSLPLPATCSNSTLTRPVLKFKIKTMAESCRKCVISPQNNCLLIAVSFVKALAGTPFFPGSTPISSSSSSSPCPPTNIYGLLRVSLVDIECRAFIPNLHSAPIRDIVCSPHSQDFILTASTDKTMKLVRIDSRSVVQR